MLGYYKNPEETQKTIVDGWLYTGDIGYVDEDGYFYITDRKKELIIVGGFNVFPREIDELIYQHPKVKEGITVGIPDPRKGERIKVYIVLKAGRDGDAGRIHRLLQGAAHAVQGSVRGRVPHGIAQKHDRQNPPARAARGRDSKGEKNLTLRDRARSNGFLSRRGARTVS